MSMITAGGIFKSFGVIFSHVQSKYDVSAAFLSWIPSCAVGIALIMGESCLNYFGLFRLVNYLATYFFLLRSLNKITAR